MSKTAQKIIKTLKELQKYVETDKNLTYDDLVYLQNWANELDRLIHEKCGKKGV